MADSIGSESRSFAGCIDLHKTEETLNHLVKENLDKKYAAFSKLIDKINDNSISEEQFEGKQLVQHLKYFLNLLPGQLTPQKITGIDSDSNETIYFVQKYYEKIAQYLIENIKIIINCNLPELDHLVLKFFAVDGGNIKILSTVMFILVHGIKITKFPSSSMDYILKICHRVVKSDLISSSIIQSCTRGNPSNLDEFCNVFHSVLSLPDIITNQTKGKPCAFPTEEFSNAMFFHAGNSIKILSEINEYFSDGEKEMMNIKSLSFFLSKILTRLSRTSQGLFNLIQVLNIWCANNLEIRHVLIDVLSNLNKSGAQSISFHILCMSKSPKNVHNVLNDIVTKVPEYKHIFVSKFPLLNYFDDVRYPEFVTNLIGYLFLASKKLLYDLVIQVIKVWSNKVAVHNTPSAQHYYLTKLIITGGLFLEGVCSSDEKDEIRKLLFTGVPVHLESCDEEIRGLGMMTAEILIPKFMNVKAETELKFTYDIFNSHTQKLISNLRNIDVEIVEMKPEGYGDDQLLLTLLGKNEESVGEVLPLKEETFETKLNNVALDSRDNNIEKESTDNEPNNYEDDDLDSDDDLVPYDTSNDVKSFKVSPPLYLRDLIDTLADRQNVEKFCVGFENAQNLIMSQLSDDDPEIGIELIQLFISLDDSYGIENFLTIKFSCCVEIICSYPIQGAEYVCKEFNAALNKYSVSDRLFMLDTLSASAKKLSESTENPNHQSKVDRKVGNKEKEWELVVKERIMSNTRRFISGKRKRVATYKNNFHDVAGYFFFPLVKDYGIGKLTFSKLEKIDTIRDEVLILTKFLNAVSVIMYCSKNAPISLRIAKEVLELVWTLRFHEESKVRLGAMMCIASVFLAAPKVNLMDDLLVQMLNYRDWLLCVSTTDPDSDCRSFAMQLCLLIKDLEFG